MKTLGIDLATEPSKTGAVTIDWKRRLLTVHDEKLDDEFLVKQVGEVDVAAIDVPLGWPMSFIDAISRHRDGDWQVSTAGKKWRQVLQYRVTDRVVQSKVGRWPLSVAADRIGSTAMRGAALQAKLRREYEVDRTGIQGVLVETYPAAVLHCWNLRSVGYKSGNDADAKLEELVKGLAQASGWLGKEVRSNLAGKSDDVVDAAICAIVAAASRLQFTLEPGDTEMGDARQEGWIHLPTASPADIAVKAALAR